MFKNVQNETYAYERSFVFLIKSKQFLFLFYVFVLFLSFVMFYRVNKTDFFFNFVPALRNKKIQYY